MKQRTQRCKKKVTLTILTNMMKTTMIPEDDSDTDPDWASTEEEARDSLEDDDEETDSMSSNYIR